MMEKLIKKLKNSYFVKFGGVITLAGYAVILMGLLFSADYILQNNEELIDSSVVIVQEEETETATETTGEGAKDKEKGESSADSNGASTPAQKDDSKPNKSEAKPSTSNKPSKPSKPTSGSDNRVWVEPVYETIEHPAVTKERKTVKGVTCMCGEYFSNEDKKATAKWQAHRPQPCDGKHVNYSNVYEIVTVIVEPAWTETVLVKEGYWKEK